MPASLFLCVILALMAAVALPFLLQRDSVRRRKRAVHAAALPLLVPFSEADGSCLAVDCTHPVAKSFTHHRGGTTPAELQADTSGGIVLNAVHAHHAWLTKRITTNHFDADALVAVFAALYPSVALKYEVLLRAVSSLGDFREIPATLGQEALVVCTWINSVEAAKFYRPFHGVEKDGCGEKFAFFLSRFEAALQLALACGGRVDNLPPDCILFDERDAFNAEFSRVAADVADLSSRAASIRVHESLGLVVLQSPRPMHYYALFSRTHGCDAVLMVYSEQRYELELKYTGYVRLASRPTRHRLDLRPLAAALNAAEASAAHVWVANSVVDSGPLLRLEAAGGATKASKATRYGHPFERTILSSSMPPAQMEAMVLSFFEFGYSQSGARSDWSWADIHEANAAVDWTSWRYYTERKCDT